MSYRTGCTLKPLFDISINFLGPNLTTFPTCSSRKKQKITGSLNSAFGTYCNIQASFTQKKLEFKQKFIRKAVKYIAVNDIVTKEKKNTALFPSEFLFNEVCKEQFINQL